MSADDKAKISEYMLKYGRLLAIATWSNNLEIILNELQKR